MVEVEEIIAMWQQVLWSDELKFEISTLLKQLEASKNHPAAKEELWMSVKKPAELSISATLFLPYIMDFRVCLHVSINHCTRFLYISDKLHHWQSLMKIIYVRQQNWHLILETHH